MKMYTGSLVLITYILIGSSFGLTEINLMELAYKNEIEKILNSTTTELISPGDEADKIIFYLFRKGLSEPDVIFNNDIYSLNNSHFDVNIPVKIIIHGFLDDVDGEMIQTVKNGYMSGDEDVNVIAVDWGRIAKNINYISVAMDTTKVGKHVATFIDFLMNEAGVIPADIHIVGHSLGAHVSGVAGSSIKSEEKVKRITGLDPALPGFGTVSIAERLDKYDAVFVDCIHTCGGLLGFYDPICHADFYPNGGTHAQPGCTFLDFGKCSHFRSFEFFAESIIKSHKFPALECNSVSKDGKECKESPFEMGNHLDSIARGLFYLVTNSKYPYAPERV